MKKNPLIESLHHDCTQVLAD